MGLINELTKYTQIVMVIIIVLAAVGGALAYYFLKIRKSNRTKEDLVNYSDLYRRNATDYIKIDDIKDNMIITDGNRRFIGVIKCRGYNFYSAQADEQGATISNFLGFINTINKPITYRQYCKAVDLEDTLKMYQESYRKLEEELFEAVEDLKDIKTTLKESDGTLDKGQRKLYMDSEEELVKRINALEFRKFHMESQMRYIVNISGTSVAPEINETWVFDWTFDPLQFSVELTEEEIYKRAVQELNAIAQAKIHSLSMCNVKAVRCKTKELIEMCRRYSAPISADTYKMSDIENSSYYEDITSSSDPTEQIEYGIQYGLEQERIREEEQELERQMHLEKTRNMRAAQEMEDLKRRSDELEAELISKSKKSQHSKSQRKEEKKKNDMEKDEEASISLDIDIDTDESEKESRKKSDFKQNKKSDYMNTEQIS